MYVDDLVSGSNTIEEVEVINQKFIEYFEKADLICVSGTQIFCHYNLPMQSLKVDLIMPKKKLKTQPILQK